MVGWIKNAGGRNGYVLIFYFARPIYVCSSSQTHISYKYKHRPFGYGMNVCNMAFYVLILSTGRVDLDYWCGSYNEGINPIMSPHVNMW